MMRELSHGRLGIRMFITVVTSRTIGRHPKGIRSAVGSSTDIVCLGRGGDITMTFTQPIHDGDGADFCVFENSFSDTFLELAWVEVSSDGAHFVRFPNFSFTNTPSQVVDASFIYGLASRYKQGKGMPFDLNQIQLAYDALGEDIALSPTYQAHLSANFPYLDLDAIRYIRLVDVVGDGSAKDADGIESMIRIRRLAVLDLI